jgi:hypothetical protein
VSVVTYRARTPAAAARRYHADAIAHASQGWVPVAEVPRGHATLSVIYMHDPAAAVEVIEVLEALIGAAPATQASGQPNRRKGHA